MESGERSSKLSGRSTRSAVDKEKEISKSGHRHFDDEAYKNETVYKKASGVTESLWWPFKVSEEQTFFGDIQGETRDPAKRKDPDYRLDVEAAEHKQKKRRREGLWSRGINKLCNLKIRLCVVYACLCIALSCVLSACTRTHNTHASAEHVLRCVLNTHIMSDT